MHCILSSQVIDTSSPVLLDPVMHRAQRADQPLAIMPGQTGDAFIGSEPDEDCLVLVPGLNLLQATQKGRGSGPAAQPGQAGEDETDTADEQPTARWAAITSLHD